MDRRVRSAPLSMLLFGAALLTLPDVLPAQMPTPTDEPVVAGRVRLTPYLGYAPSVTRQETWRHNTPAGPEFVLADIELGGATVLGAMAEIGIDGPWSFIAAFNYAPRDNSLLIPVQPADSPAIVPGSDFLIARAGFSFQLPTEASELVLRRLGASVSLAPFWMYEIAPDEASYAGILENANHFGVSLGFAGEVPFANDRFSVNFGVEDYITWWNKNKLAGLARAYFFDPSAGPDDITVDADPSHMWLLRAGLSFRF